MRTSEGSIPNGQEVVTRRLILSLTFTVDGGLLSSYHASGLRVKSVGCFYANACAALILYVARLCNRLSPVTDHIPSWWSRTPIICLETQASGYYYCYSRNAKSWRRVDGETNEPTLTIAASWYLSEFYVEFRSISWHLRPSFTGRVHLLLQFIHTG